MIKVLHGDSSVELRRFFDNRFDSMVTDPPAGISFMGKEWDHDKGGRDEWVAWLSGIMRECYRVLKPGAHGLVWSLPRTSHWTALALERAGFEIRDCVTHLFGTGFPKSLDVSKAIDKEMGVEREVIGLDLNQVGRKTNKGVLAGQGNYDATFGEPRRVYITAPATDAAKQWQGWGTALKPASEFWWLVRKPLSEKTVVANVLKHGAGGINIDACRVGVHQHDPNHSMVGRFPANLVLSHSADCRPTGTKNVKLNGSGKCSGKTTPDKSIFGVLSRARSYSNGDGTETVDAWDCTPDCAVAMLDNASGFHISYGNRAERTYQNDKGGGASRFFYCAKAGKKDRGEGNTHPTVKSTDLMEYLIKLVTPPGGVVIDPFMGSGSTGVAAKRLNLGFVGVEKERESYETAQRRLGLQEPVRFKRKERSLGTGESRRAEGG